MQEATTVKRQGGLAVAACCSRDFFLPQPSNEQNSLAGWLSQS